MIKGAGGGVNVRYVSVYIRNGGRPEYEWLGKG